MSLSNDEEDEFQSADEEGFDEDTHSGPEASCRQQDQQSNKDDDNKPNDDSDKRSESDKPTTMIEPELERTAAQKKLQLSPPLSDVEKYESKQTLNEGDEEDSEEALAERIRERNLKIARKFSAELAKSVQASAPIPVKTEPPIGFRVDDIEYPDIPDLENKTRQPLAPPPTPALSSSFSADEPTTSAPSGAQYGWRVPIKPRSKPTDASSRESDINQARAALDRLSENYTDTDKSLFQKVADDLKKVSITSKDPPTTSESDNQSPSVLPSLSSLGQTFGGWNWNNASSILASASEVKSQVSSVLDFVTTLPKGAIGQRSPGDAMHRDAAEKCPDTESKQPTAKASMSASDAMSNDAFVDLTLNAMESLGKKAFDAMTHRDETGALQIKGLGRPWEQLINTNKSRAEHQPEADSQQVEPTDVQPIVSRQPTKAPDSDTSNKGSCVRRRNVNYDDNDKLD